MADSDLSLLFRLRADNAQAKSALADTRAAVNQLRQSFGPQLTQTVTVANRAFSSLSDNLNTFVAQRLPLVGGAFVRLTEGIRTLGTESPKTEKAIATVAKSIESIATQSGKTVPQISTFLKTFIQIEGQTKRNEAAFKFFGGSVDLIGNKTAKFIPELEQASAALGEVSAESAGAGASVAAMAGPIGLAIIAAAALAAGFVVVNKQIFELIKSSADFQGKLFDLSQQVGLSVETLSALEVEARTTGGSMEGLIQSLGIFQRHLEEAQDPGTKAAGIFKKLGVETANTEQALRQSIAALARMPEGFRQTALALELFGRGGKAFLAIAKESNGDIDQITERLKNLGLVTTEQARVADEFNDQLVILEIQMRGLAAKAVPVLLDALKNLSKLLEENRGVFELLQKVVRGLATTLAIDLKIAVGVIEAAFIAAQPAIRASVALFERLKSAIEFISGHPINLFPATPAVAPEPEKKQDEDPFTKSLREKAEASRKLQNVLNFHFAEEQRRAAASIAQAQRDFEAGKKSREDLLEVTIDSLKKQTNAELETLKIERSIKVQELALAKDDVEKQKQITSALFAIDTQIANKRSELRQKEADERAKFQREAIANEIAHQERLLARSQALDQVNITGILQQVALRKKAALDGDKEIENIELTAIDRQQSLLVKKLEIAGKDTAKRKEIKDTIAALDTERTTTEQRHSQQRLAIVQTEADTTLVLIRTKGNALIATTEALAERRVITEEEAQRRIAKIRLDALDAEIALAQARGADTRVLEAQREAFARESERNIEAGRQRDLENERRYERELKEIKRRVSEVERDAAREVIRLMSLHFANRKDILRARLQADIADENARHSQALETIANLDQENRESNKTAQEKLDAEREINLLREAEAERHRLAMQGIKDAGKKDEETADPFGRLNLDTDSLKEFARVIEDSIVPLGQILTDTFRQVSDAIGQTVANWVLLGETGPAVMRKILAQALASIAAEAAVNAIKELALGFATLFFNPAESAAHFTAAGLWAAISGVSAVAGRGVAGDLFKQKSASDTATSGGREGSPQDLQTIVTGRNQRQIVEHVHIIRVQSNDSHILEVLSKDFRNGGKTRDLILNDGGV